MAKQGGMGSRFYIGGNDISGDIQSVATTGGMTPLDVTDITQSAHSRLGGLRNGGLNVVSFWDSALAHPVFSALPTGDTLATYAVGAAIGQPCVSQQCLQIDYDPTRAADGSLTEAVATQSDGFGQEWGVLLTPGMRTDTTATAASSANSWDTGASASFGGQAYLHVSVITGTSVTVSVWDSADNSSFSAVSSLAFTAVSSAPAFQRVAIGNTATIRRYVAVATTGTFTVATFAVQLTKNTIAGQVF